MKTKRASKTLSLLLALCMVMSLLPTVAYAAEEEYHYIDENGAEQTVSIDSANVIDSNWDYTTNILTDGWYVVTGTVAVGAGGYGLGVNGDAHLILSDGAALTASSGIYLASGNSLTIYGQSGGTGSLTAQSGSGYTAIGTYGGSSGSLAIYGGTVNAQGDSAGIDVDQGLTISGGTVTASASNAILAGAVTITGGTVTANSERSDPYYYGIYATTLTISGGTVKTTGGEYGLKSYSDSIVIDGGSVNATASVQPKNSAETPVYKTTLLLPEAGPGASVSGTVSPAVGYYSVAGVKTDGEGKAYLWLPEGEAQVNLTAGSESYSGTFTVKTDDSTLWPLVTRTVTFDPKGGTMTDPTTNQTGAELKLAALPAAPTLEGYTFDGWYSDYYGGEKITTDTVFYLDATVYARWKAAVGDETTDTRNIDVSRLTVNHTETGVWSYSAADKTLTVQAADGSLTLTGTNNNLQVKVTGAGALVLSNAAISAGGDAVSFSNSAGESTLELAAGTVNTLGGSLYSDRKLILSGTGALTVTDTRDWKAAITVYSASLVIDGPDVVANGCFYGLSMGLSTIATGVLDVRSGSLTLDRTNKHYSYTVDSSYTGLLTVNVGSDASLTILNGDTTQKTIINNNGGTVYIDGNVAGTANNHSGTFTVTGGVAASTGDISKPEVPEVAIDLSALEAGGTEYYELIDGGAIPDADSNFLPFDGYTVIKIKKPARVTLTGTAQAGHVLWDRHTTSEYILDNISIDGLAHFAFQVTVTGTNHVGSFGIPVAGGANNACTYAGGGRLTVQNSAGKNPYGAFPAYSNGTAVIDGCTVEISGFADASDAIRVKSGALTADGRIGWLTMEGGRADIWYLYDGETNVEYSGGALALFGRLDDEYSDKPGSSVTFETNGGSDMPGLYLYGIDSYEMTAPEVPVKTGLVFDGWRSDEALTQPVTFPLTVTETAVYYADWRASSISITRQSQDITVVPGETGELSVEVEGGTPSYQWYSTDQDDVNYGGTKLEGATSSVFIVPATLELGESYYYCKITAGQDVIHSDVATVKVKLPQDAPDAPVLNSKTATSVTLNDRGYDYEYRCGGTGDWQESNVFRGLSPDTEYTFYLRLAETYYKAPSPAGPGLPVTTEQAELEGDAHIVGTLRYGEMLQADTSGLTIGGDPAPSAVLRYQWQRSDGAVTVIGTASTYTLTAADIGYSIILTVTADGCPGESTETRGPVQKGVRTPPPAPTGSYTGNGFNFTYTVNPVDGVKYGVKYAGGAYTWIDSNVFTGQFEGGAEFYLRYLETDIYVESGDSAALSVTFVKLDNPQAPPLSYTVSGESGNRTITITEVTGAEYKFGDDSWGSASSKGGYDNTSGEVTIQIRYAQTNTHHASAAASAQVSPGKESQSAPAAFALGYEGVDDTGYTVTIPLTDGAEYSFDGLYYSGVNTKADCLPGQTVAGYKRMAATDAYNASPSTSAEVTLPLFQVKTPTASPNGGTFTASQSVTLATATAGAEIRYTTNGSAPTAGSALYTGAISLTDTTTIKAIAVKPGMADSAVLTVTFTKSGGGSDNGGPGGVTPPTPTAPTTSGGTATTSVTPTVTNGTASATVTNAQVNSAIEAAQAAAEKSGEKPGVEIAISGASGASRAAVTLPRSSVQSLATGGIDALTVSGPVATVRFDSGALATINAAAGDVTVEAARVEAGALPEAARAIVGDHPVYDFSVTSGGKAISSFGGTVTVSIPYAPAAGDNPANLVIYYISDSGSVERVPNARYDAATGTIIFTTDHFSYYAVGYKKILFTDVQPGAWYFAAVNFIAEKGITTGTGSGKFSPDATLTRGQFITMLLRAYDIETDVTPADNFSDAGNTYYTGYLAAAKRLGISSGVGDNRFAPEQSITRQEMFTLLYNALKVIGALPEGNSGRTLSDFTDSGDIASWASEALTALVNSGTISGNNGKLDPKDTTTRAQMAQVLYNLMSK